MTPDEGPGSNPEQWHINRLVRRSVSVRWRPVMLYRDNCQFGIGSIFTNHQGKERIVTAGHLFGKSEGTHTWSYRRMRPLVNYRQPILSAGLLVGGEEHDAAICIPGESSLPPITGFCPESHGPKDRETGTFASLSPKFSVCSLVTGMSTDCIGTLKRRNVEYLVTPLKTYGGESGTGFVDGNDDNIYVLKGHIEVDQTMGDLAALFGDTAHLSVLCRLTVRQV